MGGGDTAVEDALYLSFVCRSVTVALRRNEFRGAKRRVGLLKTQKNVTIRYETHLTEIQGTGHVEEVILNGPEGPETLPMDGVFLAVGVTPASQWMRELPQPFPRRVMSWPAKIVSRIFLAFLLLET